MRNFTDVDDKIIRRAAEARAALPPPAGLTQPPQAGTSCEALTERFVSEFHTDMASLRCLPPDLEPRATAHVGDIVALIQRIMAHGHAYRVPDSADVYFEVSTLPGYGRLSGRGEGDNRAGERVALDSRKRGPSDFALWKARIVSPPMHDSHMTPRMLCLRRAPSRASPAGSRPGARGGRAGTSSAPP